MKIQYFILTIIVLITGSKLTGYNTGSSKTITGNISIVRQSARAENISTADTISDWQQFKIDVNVQIDKNEKRINVLKTDMKSDGKKVKASYKKEVARLERQNNDLKVKINVYKYDGKEKWAAFKKGFNHDMDAVGNSINNLFTKK